jgi:leucyl-tRNA---protein transferase
MRDPNHDFLEWLDQHELPRAEVTDCHYLPGKQARYYGFSSQELDADLYQHLMDRGFRRTGNIFYAMDCPGCSECIPLRVPVAEFLPSKSQRRTQRKNADLRVEFAPPAFSQHSYALYRRYLCHQHPTTPQDDSLESFQELLYGNVVPALEARYYLDNRMVGVSLLDATSKCLSAVYHFFDPDYRHRSIGVYSAMMEIQHAKSLGLPYYYFGYWIKEAATMAYKANFRPFELLKNGHWLPKTSAAPE